MIEAICRWRDAQWHRYDDLEGSCAMQLLKHALDAQAADPGLGYLHVQIESFQPTPQMLAGIAPVVGMKRPDFRLTLGRGRGGRTIECKRLRLSGGLPKEYVYNGMARFVSGTYATDEPVGTMIGFLQSDSPSDVVASINTHVVSHSAMGTNHQLRRMATSWPKLDLFESTHPRVSLGIIRLEHQIVDLR